MKQHEHNWRSRASIAKRLFDIMGAIIGIIILGPIIILVAMLVISFDGPPILFRQSRAGLNGRKFELIKFRTMLHSEMGNDRPLSDNERITRIGKLLRRTSLDELPQLWNVIKGEMSLVGPRPLLMDYLPLYTCEQSYRHEVKPGITGWAQVNGRNSISWEDRFVLDAWYVDNQSFLLDLKILLLTNIKIVTGEGISQKSHVTMERFEGTSK